MEPHDIPPPPYSETDIYSGSDHHLPLAPTDVNSLADDTSTAASSSHSNIIYTPPDTPQDSAFAGAEDLQTTASAQVYFDTRAASTHRNSSFPIIHPIIVADDPTPSEFPYPNWAAERDVTQQDWRTFINYLIPDFADKANACIIDRKLRASEDGDARSSASTRDATEAQLDQLRSSSQRRRFQDTVKEWNAGFFGPRGVTIRLVEGSSAGEPKARMPGEWDSSFDAGTGSSRDASQPAASGPTGEERGGWRSLFGQRFAMNADDRGFRFGPITIDGDRIAIGNAFEADSGGVRWNGRDVSEHMPGGHDRGRGWGSGRGRWWHDLGDSHRQRRGGRGGPGGRHRSRSVHSSSSVSTSSSSDSDSTVSSIGSLPDWDDLKDSQLPVVKQSVEAWLARPEQTVTKADLKRAKVEIKAAKSLPQPASVDTAQREEIKALLSLFDDLKKHQRVNLRAATKQRRAERKAERRTRRCRNRGERHEERRHRREHRRAEREMGRQQRRRGGALDTVPPVPQSGAQMPMPPHPPAPGPSHSAPFVPPTAPAPAGQGIPPVPPVSNFGPGSFFGPGRSGGPGFPFGGGSWGNYSHHRGPWQHSPPTPEGSRAQPVDYRQAAQAHVQAYRDAAQAQAQAYREAASAQARAYTEAAQAKAQANQAKAQAKQQADQGNIQAKQQANQAKAQAKQQAEQAKAQAKQQAEQAKAQAKQQKAQAKKQVKGKTVQTQAPTAQGTYSAKYREVEQLEQQIKGKGLTLQALQQSMESESIAAARAGNGDQKRAEPSQTELDAEALENEIVELSLRIEDLVVKADEELARNMEREENERMNEGKVRWLD
ncbi:hypothetical protein SCUP515_11627 [Seiridium cupressi]